MKKIKYIALAMVSLVLFSFTLHKDVADKKFKCLVQMTNYKGEGAYVVVSVVDDKGEYVKTLQVFGDDPEWYPDIEKWWAFQRKKTLSDIDAISGETLSGGERNLFLLNIDEKYLNKGYKLRFETAVEEVDYHPQDVEIELNTNNLKGKVEGKGFIRYVRLLPIDK